MIAVGIDKVYEYEYTHKKWTSNNDFKQYREKLIILSYI